MNTLTTTRLISVANNSASHFKALDELTNKENSTLCLRCNIWYHQSRKIEFSDGICKFCLNGRAAQRVVGLGSICADGQHFLMWDFDNTPLHWITWDLRKIQENFRLGPIHILRSSPGDNYQAVCFDKFSAANAEYILKATRTVDLTYRYVYSYRERATLRLTPKGKYPLQYVCTLQYDSEWLSFPYEQSLGGYLLYANLFPEIAAFNIPLDKTDMLPYPFLEGYISRHIGRQHIE